MTLMCVTKGTELECRVYIYKRKMLLQITVDVQVKNMKSTIYTKQ